jgi:dethiobiotin synthetase
MIRLGITGTSTGVGKTIVAAGVAAALAKRELRVGVMKPVETGVNGETADAKLLVAAAGSSDPLDVVCPQTFAEPLAPWVAAERAIQSVDLERLNTSFQRITSRRDAVIVETSGGLMTPLTRDVGFHSLFERWGLDLLVVAGNVLGALNHTLLTVAAARQARLRTIAVVLKDLSPEPQSLAAETNADALARLLPGTTVLVFPWVSDAADISQLAEAAERSRVISLLTGEARRSLEATTPMTVAHSRTL